jgi:hypothetical protein
MTGGAASFWFGVHERTKCTDEWKTKQLNENQYGDCMFRAVFLQVFGFIVICFVVLICAIPTCINREVCPEHCLYFRHAMNPVSVVTM